MDTVPLSLITMRLKPKLLNAIILGLTMILSTAPSINPHRYAIHPHHHPPQNTLQSRTHWHPSMDSQRWNPVLAPLHLPQIWLLQRHKANEAAGLQRDPAASWCLYIWGEWNWGVYVVCHKKYLFFVTKSTFVFAWLILYICLSFKEFSYLSISFRETSCLLYLSRTFFLSMSLESFLYCLYFERDSWLKW